MEGHPGHEPGQAIPHADSADQARASDLEQGLRAVRPTAIGALLIAVAVLRIGAVGAGQAIALDLTDLGFHRPSGATVGLVGASQALSEMVFAPILARYADRLGRTRFLIGGPVIGGLGMLLVALGVHPRQIAGARLLEGLAAAAFVPTALGTVAAATTDDGAARARASGAFEAANLAGYALGFVVGPFAYFYFHRGAFLVLAALYLTAAGICLRFIPKVPPLPVSPLGAVMRAVLGAGPIRSFLPAWLAVFALIGAFAANLTATLNRAPVHGQTLVHGFDARVISAFLVGWAVLLLAGIALWTPLLPRLGAVITMRRALPGALLVCLGLAAINHTRLQLAPLLLPIVVVGVLLEAGFGPAAVVYLAECSETFTADRSALMAFYTVTLAGGGAVGAILGGLAAAWLYVDGLVILGAVLASLAYLSLGRVLRYEQVLVRERALADQDDNPNRGAA